MDEQRLRALLADRYGYVIPIQELLKSSPELLSGGAMLEVGNVRTNAAMCLGDLALKHAEQRGPDDAVRWLRKVLSATNVSVLEVMPLWGLDISQPIELTASIRLVLLNEIPNSQRRMSGKTWNEGADTPGYEFSAATTALVARTTKDRIIWAADDDWEPDLSIDNLLHDVRQCLTLVAPNTIVPGPQWPTFDDPDLESLAVVGGLSRRGVEVRPRVLRSFGAFDPKRAQDLVQSYLRLDDNTRARIRLALERFDRALRRHAPGDSAMELAIGLDSLVGDGEGELTWKVSLRSALLVPGTKSERLERRAVVQALYRLRSKVVHTGHAPNSVEKKGQGRLSPAELMSKATIVTAEVISAAILRGSLPDWFNEELGH